MPSALRPVRRFATVLTSIGLAGLIASSTVLAGTPVSVGWRDHAYGGGAFRPSSDKPQSKLWYTDEGASVQWWAGMFRLTASLSEFQIYKLSPDKSTWSPTGIAIDKRDNTHGDYLWDESEKKLYVASVAMPNNSEPFAVPTTADNVRVFRFSYAAGAWTALSGAGAGIPGTASTASPQFRGGAWTVSIDKDSTGRLWAVWPNGTRVMYSTSTDDGVTWSTAAQLPAQASNSIKSGTLSQSDTATVIGFGNGSKTTIGVAWSDQDSAPANTNNGYYFATIAATDDPSVGGNWTTAKLPPPSPGLATIYADNHINIKATSNGTLYMVGKARTDTINCADLKNRLLTPFYRRTTAGDWSVQLAGTVGDCDTRPQLVIDEQTNPDIAYIFVTSPNGGGAIYRKAAPLSGPDAFDFRGTADELVKRGVTFIRSTTDTLIDDASTTKQLVTNESGIAVIANNLSSSAGGNAKVYLHNYMPLPSSDSTPPSGTVAINGGAATTGSSSVTMTVTANDGGSGSGMALVRLSNSNSVDGNGVLNGAGSTSYTYTPSIAWTMTAGLGTKTVYAQWRDAAGNWSAVSSDTIEVIDDATPPNPPASITHTLAGSGGFTIPVRLSWPAATDNKGVTGYRITRSINGGALTEIVANQPGLTHYMGLSNTSATYRFCVQARDAAGNISASRCTPTFRASSYSESNAALRFSSGWNLSSSTVYIGGKARFSSTRNASVTMNFTGNRVGWYAKTGPTYGQARVYINGVLTSTVNLYSATDQNRRLVFSRSFSSIATRSIRIVVVGTAGHPKVVVDQLFVLR